MLHDPKRIQLVERWSCWLAWLYLFSGTINIILILIIQLTNQEDTSNYLHEYLSNFWYHTNEVLIYLGPIVKTLATSFLLWGISIVIRFLRKYYAQITSMV